MSLFRVVGTSRSSFHFSRDLRSRPRSRFPDDGEDARCAREAR